MADYDQLEKSYNNGSNWCSYGWSKDQLALFPTQKSLYNYLKKYPGHENDCGRPGINGGYFKNKYLKFGVNCYGTRPKAKDKDKNYMHEINHTPQDKPSKTKKKKPQKDYSKYIIAPFNKEKWSRSD